MNKKCVFGIDLGTTNSCIAIYGTNGFEVIEIDNSKTIPSVVAYDQDLNEWLVGESAKNFSKISPSNAALSIKREMGKIDHLIKLGPHTLSPEEISAKILNYLKVSAEKKLSANIEDEKVDEKVEVKDVVITVPAYFNDLQRRATLNAGMLANLNVLRIINEPTAAALIHEISETTLHPHLHPHITASEKWIVYDLGGGTFDVSIIEAKPHYKEVLASTGNNLLGGDDFDNILARYVLKQMIKDDLRIKENLNNISNSFAICAKLKCVAEDVKIALSTDSHKEINDFCEFKIAPQDTTITLPIKLSISRDTFQALIEPFIDSTIELVQQALQLANCQINEISRLLLVGGSTKIPFVREKLFTAFALHADSYINPDTSVALGAAVQAAISAKLNFDNIIIDVSPHSLGVAAFGHIDIIKQLSSDEISTDNHYNHNYHHPKTFIPIILRNSKLPASFEKIFYTSFPLQKQIEVAIYQGESQSVEDNIFIGSFIAELKPNKDIIPLNLNMEYDLNGIIKVTISSYQNKEVIISHRMDLKIQVLPSSQTETRPTNFLINKVEEILKNSCSSNYCSEYVQIKQMLEHYRFLLTSFEGDDCCHYHQKYYNNENNDNTNNENFSIDFLENKLYDWIESQTNNI